MNIWTSKSLRWIVVEELLGGTNTVRRYIPITPDISISEDLSYKNSRCIITYMNSSDISIHVLEPIYKVMSRVVGKWTQSYLSDTMKLFYDAASKKDTIKMEIYMDNVYAQTKQAVKDREITAEQQCEIREYFWKLIDRA